MGVACTDSRVNITPSLSDNLLDVTLIFVRIANLEKRKKLC